MLKIKCKDVSKNFDNISTKIENVTKIGKENNIIKLR